MRPVLTLTFLSLTIAAATLAGLAGAVLPRAFAGPDATSARLSASAIDAGDALLISGLGESAKRAQVFLVDGQGRRVRQRIVERHADGVSFEVRGTTGAHEVLVGRGSRAATAGVLSIRPPRIESLVFGRSTARGDDLVVEGRNFGTRRATIEIAGRPARVRGWSDRSVTVRTERPATGPHDVILHTANSDAAAPCGILVCGGASIAVEGTVEGEPEPGGSGAAGQIQPHNVWKLDWTPGTPGQSSSHNNGRWNWNHFIYDAVLERFRFEANVDPDQALSGLALMINEGGSPTTQPDVNAEVYFDLSHGAPRTTVYAYRSRLVNDANQDGWPDAGKPGIDYIASSLLDDSFVLWTTDRQEADGTRTVGFELDCREINAHHPKYGRTDGSAWRGLRFGSTIGTWAYLQPKSSSTYVDGLLTWFDFGPWGTYPGIDGPDFHGTSVPWQTWMTSRPVAPVPGSDTDGSPAPSPGLPVLRDGEANVIHGTDFADGLNGTDDGDAMRAGPGGDRLDGGAGDDLILVDRASVGSRIDGGAGANDTLVLRAAPGSLPLRDGTRPIAVTLVIDPASSGARPSVDATSDSELRLGDGARGRLVFPGGRTVEFSGIEVIRF